MRKNTNLRKKSFRSLKCLETNFLPVHLEKYQINDVNEASGYKKKLND